MFAERHNIHISRQLSYCISIDISTGKYSDINEAPSLPPRLYSWSDVEDDDDELFLSDGADSAAMVLPQKSMVTDGFLHIDR